jgi:predicted DNA-binding protein (MmcQ/YjbR family)
MNKKHWNTIVVDGSVLAKQLKEWIGHLYELVAVKKKNNEPPVVCCFILICFL